jgi:O-antigen ligase
MTALLLSVLGMLPAGTAANSSPFETNAVLRNRLGLHSRGLGAWLLALGLMALAAFTAPLWTGQAWSLALSSTGLIAAAAGVTWMAVGLQRLGLGRAAFRAFCVGLMVAGMASCAVGLIQAFAPTWADGSWMALSSFPGRASGNLRQPNHLSSLLLWALMAWVWWWNDAQTRLGLRGTELGLRMCSLAGVAGGVLLLYTVVLTASRTGALSVLMLLAWAWFDRSLSRHTRWFLCLSPLIFGLMWWGMSEWAHINPHVFAGAEQLNKADPSSSRMGVWRNALSLVAAHPWSGVGWGEFNFAWTLTPFPGRPVAFFDHTHNLPLQLLVELGVPLGVLVMSLLGYALMDAARKAYAALPFEPSHQRAALTMVLTIFVHSLLEYPLWYAYFLLPMAFALGLCLSPSGQPSATQADHQSQQAGSTRTQGLGPVFKPWMLVASIALMLSGPWSVADYGRVVAIFEPESALAVPPQTQPGGGIGSLAQRIVHGQGSWLFAHHANYAAATTANPPESALPAFKGAAHYLLDARLMMAWANALNHVGELDQARYIAQRLKEFRNDQATAFFEPCEDPDVAATDKPFQCQAPQKAWGFADFR